MKKVLTDKTVTNLKAAQPGKRSLVGDAVVPGLSVRITDSGHKTYVLGARFPGSPHFVRREIAQVGAVTLAAARDTARGWLVQIKAGKDPRVAIAAARADTLAAVVEDFVKRRLKGQRKAAIVERDLRRDVLPVLGARPITEITRLEIVRLVEAIKDRGTTGAHARNILGYLKTLFNFAIGREIYGIEISPCDRIQPKVTIGKKLVRTRHLDNDEIRAVWRAAGRVGYPWGPLIQMILLTGCRLSEITNARWGEFSQSTFTIPAERYKSDEIHIIPLTDQMKALLANLPRWKAGDHLFSTTDGRIPVAGFAGHAKTKLDREVTRSWRALGRIAGTDRRAATLPNWSPHDLRRTMRTRLSRLAPHNVAELAIGHGKKGLDRVYDQHQYADELREAFVAWNNALETIVAPPPANNVVPLRVVS